MSSHEKNTNPSERDHTAPGLHAEKAAIEHDIRNARDVVRAKAEAAAANAKVDMAKAKRDVEHRIDEVRVDADKKR